MNTKSYTVAVVLAAFAVAAAAAAPTEGSIGNETVGQSVKTRAEVRAELFAAQRDGSFQVTNEAYATSTTPFISTLSRAEVRKEAIVAARSAQRGRVEYSPYVGG